MEILLVEDKESIRRFIERLLKNDQIKSCDIGGKALEIISQWEPDLVISDVKLPDISGIEVAKKIKKKIPIILMSAIPDFEETAKRLDCQFLLKPFDSQVLLNLVNKFREELKNENLNC